MTLILRRSGTADELGLTKEHELLTLPRKGSVNWAAFDRSAHDEKMLAAARETWRHRAFTEFHSLTHFTQLASQLHLLGAPLDWSGAFARMVSDEARHTELCLRMVEALGGEGDLQLPSLDGVHLQVSGSLRSHVRSTVITAFCIGETLSGRMFKRCLAAATVPLAREVVTAILIDETFHAELGWELAALLMRNDDGLEAEIAVLERQLPTIIEALGRQCLVSRSPDWTRAQPEFDDQSCFGSLSQAGYAQAFFAGMEEDVVPGLEAIGLRGARDTWVRYLASLPG